MAWVRYDDQFPHHPKVAEVKLRDRAALALHLLCGTWSASTTTPGLVSQAAAVEQAGTKARATKWAKILIDAGLWHAPGHDCPRCPAITIGYVIHDWKIYNPLEELAKKRSDAGKKGAAARWGRRQPPDTPIANATEELSQTHSGANGISLTKDAPSPSPSPSPIGGSVGRHPAGSGAGAHDEDDFGWIDEQIAKLLTNLTGHDIDLEWAAVVRRGILTGRKPRDPLAYITAAIRGEPHRYQPPTGDPTDRSVEQALALGRCPHGDPRGRHGCALCRRGIPADEEP